MFGFSPQNGEICYTIIYIIRQIQLHRVGGKTVVNSFEFYKELGLRRQHYTRWIMENVYLIGVQPDDYFPTEDNMPGRTMRYRFRFYFTIDFAIGLCMMARRKEALELRRFLIANK